VELLNKKATSPFKAGLPAWTSMFWFHLLKQRMFLDITCTFNGCPVFTEHETSLSLYGSRTAQDSNLIPYYLKT